MSGDAYSFMSGCVQANITSIRRTISPRDYGVPIETVKIRRM
jgi:hypothetical protein